MLKEGAKAPDFSLSNDEGKTFSLKDFKGKKIVLYFYPRDNTPGCTTEACGFRDVYDEILAKGAVVIGVSADSETSHQKFKKKFDLPFYLLSDPDKTCIKAYNAWGEKSMYGKMLMGILRSTFVIDEKGMVIKVFPKVSPKEHAKEVLEVLDGK
ncbi:MAG: thioredoxin-dependent thiol peroxidase [Spirochaetales bacterium]|nr:thioredoxin-dependent thiol peroxidase [Spirochaetales bacterium]